MTASQHAKRRQPRSGTDIRWISRSVIQGDRAARRPPGRTPRVRRRTARRYQRMITPTRRPGLGSRRFGGTPPPAGRRAAAGFGREIQAAARRRARVEDPLAGHSTPGRPRYPACCSGYAGYRQNIHSITADHVVGMRRAVEFGAGRTLPQGLPPRSDGLPGTFVGGTLVRRRYWRCDHPARPSGGQRHRTSKSSRRRPDCDLPTG